MMKDVDAFCRENGIRSNLSDGTMLGAVRHGGFIPWDDEAGLCMLREDFDRFAAMNKSDRFHLLLNTHDKDVPKDWFDSLVDIDFNGHKFLGFKDTHSYLNMLFGPDYMTPKEWSHHYSIMKKLV